MEKEFKKSENIIEKALMFATLAHAGQIRKRKVNPGKKEKSKQLKN